MFEDVKAELDELFRMMKRGEKYPATPEMEAIVDKIIEDQFKDIDVEQWAKKLADDIIGSVENEGD